MSSPGEQPTLSVVMPTYQCRRLMERHLASMAEWSDLADEVVVIDSRSTDGTLDYLRENLRHPRLRIIERERGLYASWNEGVAATAGKWIYISTAGDTITRAHLSRLVEAGGRAGADVVASPCLFVDVNGRPIPPSERSNPRIFCEFSSVGDVVIAPPAVRHFAFRGAGTQALLGSCASDLFRGDFLRARPFPLEYGTHGDTAWLLRHSHEMRLCLLKEAGSTFCVHPRAETETKAERMLILDRMHAEEIGRGGLTPALESAIRLRRLNRLRRRPWRGPASAFTWAADNLRYLTARIGHGRLESRQRREIEGLITGLARSG